MSLFTLEIIDITSNNKKESKEKKIKKKLTEVEEAQQRIRRNVELTCTVQLKKQEEQLNFGKIMITD